MIIHSIFTILEANNFKFICIYFCAFMLFSYFDIYLLLTYTLIILIVSLSLHLLVIYNSYLSYSYSY